MNRIRVEHRAAPGDARIAVLKRETVTRFGSGVGVRIEPVAVLIWREGEVRAWAPSGAEIDPASLDPAPTDVFGEG
ncbi:MAG: GerW family sporulation protein [Rubricella sp.]